MQKKPFVIKNGVGKKMNLNNPPIGKYISGKKIIKPKRFEVEVSL